MAASSLVMNEPERPVRRAAMPLVAALLPETRARERLDTRVVCLGLRSKLDVEMNEMENGVF